MIPGRHGKAAALPYHIQGQTVNRIPAAVLLQHIVKTSFIESGRQKITGTGRQRGQFYGHIIGNVPLIQKGREGGNQFLCGRALGIQNHTGKAAAGTFFPDLPDQAACIQRKGRRESFVVKTQQAAGARGVRSVPAQLALLSQGVGQVETGHGQGGRRGKILSGRHDVNGRLCQHKMASPLLFAHKM